MEQTLESIYEQIAELYAQFEENHAKQVNGNKSAGTRSRGALGDLKKLVTAYRKASTDFCKNIKK
jgi:hypothetical protein